MCALKTQQNKGFTLVEMLVYISILVIVAGGALTLLFSLEDRMTENRAHQLVAQAGKNTLERMLSDIRAADTVDTLSSTFEVSPGVLEVVNASNTARYAVASGSVLLTVDGQNVGRLTDERVSIDQLRFYHYNTGETELVRAELSVTATVRDATVSRTFTAGAVLRGSYD